MPSQPLLRRLADPRSPENAVLWSAGAGVLTLVDPAPLSAAGRFAYRAASALAVGVGMAMEMNAEDTDVAALAPLALPVGAAGLVFSLSELSEAWDRRIIEILAGAGVSRPRLLLAAGTTAVSLAAFALSRRFPSPVEPDGDELPQLEPLPTDVRDLVLGMLATTDGYGSDVLRAQLNSTQVKTWPDDDWGAWSTDFAVMDDSPLAVPHTFTFPVKAQFTSTNGQRLQAMLLVEDGLLDSLVLDTVSDDGWEQEPGLAEPLERWPSLDEVTFVKDSADRWA